jgi:hypothetical protein
MKYTFFSFIFLIFNTFFLLNGCKESKELTKINNKTNFTKAQEDSLIKKHIEAERAFMLETGIQYKLAEKRKNKNANWESLDSLYRDIAKKYKKHQYFPTLTDDVVCYYVGIATTQVFKFVDNNKEKTKKFLNYYKKEFLESRSGQLEGALFLTNLIEKHEGKKAARKYAQTLLKTFAGSYGYFDKYLNDPQRGKKENKTKNEQERFDMVKESVVLLRKLEEIAYSK